MQKVGLDPLPAQRGRGNVSMASSFTAQDASKDGGGEMMKRMNARE